MLTYVHVIISSLHIATVNWQYQRM